MLFLDLCIAWEVEEVVSWNSEKKKKKDLANFWLCQDYCSCDATRTNIITYILARLNICTCLLSGWYMALGYLQLEWVACIIVLQKKRKKKGQKLQIYTKTKLVYKRGRKHSIVSDDIIVEEKPNCLCLFPWKSGFVAFSVVLCMTVIGDLENMIC